MSPIKKTIVYGTLPIGGQNFLLNLDAYLNTILYNPGVASLYIIHSLVSIPPNPLQVYFLLSASIPPSHSHLKLFLTLILLNFLFNFKNIS